MNVVSRGIRNAFRNVIRTMSLVIILGLSIGLALAMLVANQAVAGRIKQVQASVGNTVSISPAGVRGFQGGGTALTGTELTKVAELPHVTSLSETLSDRLTTSNTNLVSAIDAGSLGQRFANNSGQGFAIRADGNGPPDMVSGGTTGGTSDTVVRTFTPPITVVGTTDPTNLSSDTQGGGSFTLKSGKIFDGASSDNVAVIGKTLATKNSLSVGSTFTAYGSTVTVVGIFDAGNRFSNNQIIMPLKSVQTLSAQPDAVTSATANVDSITNVDGVTANVSKLLGTAADVTNGAATAKQTIAPLKNIQTVSLYSLIGAVGAGAIIILLTMIMIVRERRREIGVIKAIGASNVKVMTQFMVEAITLTMLGAIVGIILGVVAGKPITNALVTNSSTSSTVQQMGPGGPGRGFRSAERTLSTIHAAIGWSIIGYGLLAALAIAIIGSALASFFIAKIRPAEVMRAE